MLFFNPSDGRLTCKYKKKYNTTILKRNIIIGDVYVNVSFNDCLVSFFVSTYCIRRTSY